MVVAVVVAVVLTVIASEPSCDAGKTILNPSSVLEGMFFPERDDINVECINLKSSQYQDFIEGENAAMNPSVTPMRHEVEGWLPVPLDVAGIVYDYLGNPFVTLWEVPKGLTLRLPLVRHTGEGCMVDFLVSWGDGMTSHIRTFRDEHATHTYSAAGQYRVHVTGTIRCFGFGGSCRHTAVPVQDCSELRAVRQWNNCGFLHEWSFELLEVSQWGCVRLLNGGSKSFKGCYKLTVTARDAPVLKDAKDLSEMFAGCVSLRKEDFSGWDTSGVTNMRGMFDGCDQFNGNVSKWSTRNVMDMSGMFRGCRSFNGDLSHWKTGCVTDMNDMFMNCVSFNGDLSHWDTCCVTDMNGMFRNCLSFNGDLSRWATGNVVSIQEMFMCCTSFQGGDLRSWDTRRVTNMRSAFNGCTVFNGDLRTWITGRVLYMDRMFEGCRSFNGDLGRWDTSKVIYAMEMFLGCASFRGDLSSWDIGSLYPYDSEEEDFGIIIDRICGGLGSVIPQDFRPSRRVNRLRSGKRWRT